jgi:ATP-binding cassette subfamily E protein 1
LPYQLHTVIIGSHVADYFTKILEDDLKAIVKPQYVDRIPKAIKGPDKTVRTLIEGSASMDNLEEVLDVLGKTVYIESEHEVLISLTELNHIMDRDVNLLSGGELQRFAIGTVCVQQADVYVTSLAVADHNLIRGTVTCSTNLLPTLMSSSV